MSRPCETHDDGSYKLLRGALPAATAPAHPSRKQIQEAAQFHTAGKDDRVPALVEKVGLALAAASPEFGLVAPPASDDRLLAEEVRRVLESMAAAGGFVVLGRGGQAVLRDRSDACHLQLVADLADRVA